MKEMERKLKLFVMDDSDIFRAGLAEVLIRGREDFELSGCGETSDEAEELCATAAPDVLVVHASVREMDKHLQIIDRIKKKVEGVRVLVVAEFTDIEYLLKIAASRCDGYVHSSVSEDSLVRVIQNLANDVYIFDRTVIDKVLLLQDERRNARRTEFSQRERRIVEMMGEGRSNAAIAKELNLSAGTVKNIISDMLKRNHFKNRTQLVNALLS
ncbi:MAG: response regulator transcription factor [Synergistaceae bacterium]|jgi:DNA-binding NarL/FixJ family response regulator|nr:response regulator transcription factor [Synergistaceae bacterium]